MTRFGLGTDKMAHVAFIRGLKVYVDGASNEKGPLAAKTATVDGDDLETSEMIQAGIKSHCKGKSRPSRRRWRNINRIGGLTNRGRNQELAETATGLKSCFIEVIGYADSTGRNAINTKPSENHAGAVITYLIQKGGAPIAPNTHQWRRTRLYGRGEVAGSACLTKSPLTKNIADANRSYPQCLQGPFVSTSS